MSTVKSDRPSKLRWIGGAAAVAALSIVGALAVATPASAGTGDCPSQQTCLWRDADFVTAGIGWIYVEYRNGIKDFGRYSFDFSNGPLNDNVTSVWNNGNSQRTYVFQDAGFQGYLVSYAIHSGTANLGWANDVASSAGFQFCVDNPSSALCV